MINWVRTRLILLSEARFRAGLFADLPQMRNGKWKMENQNSCLLLAADCLLVFRFLPERLHLIERGSAKRLTALAQLPFDIAEATAKLPVG